MVPVDDWVIADLIANVRAADRLEFESIHGNTVEEEVRLAVSTSEECSAFVREGHVVAVFGCIKFDEKIGIPWMISTHFVLQHKRAFLQNCLIEVAKMRTRHAALINYTDARYTLALRWMLWMGFDQQEAIAYGANGEPFYPFTMKGDLWAQEQGRALPQAADC